MVEESSTLDKKLKPLEPENIDFETFINYCSIDSFFNKNDGLYKIYKYNPEKPFCKLVSHLSFSGGLDNPPIFSISVDYKSKSVKTSLSGQKKGNLVSYTCLFNKDKNTLKWNISTNNSDLCYLDKNSHDKFVSLLTYLNFYLNQLPLPEKDN